MSGTINPLNDLDIRRVLAERLGSIRCKIRRARLAEAIFRCKAGRISYATRLAYSLAKCVHGERKTSMLFTRFLLHAQEVEHVDYVEPILEEAGKDLLAGRLSAQQVEFINHTLWETRSGSKLPEHG